MSEPRRAKPPIEVRERILIGQRGACFWCQLPLDSTVWRGSRSVDYELEWDHAVPWAYLQRSPDDNWVASCQVCNGIKSDLHFRSVEQARRSIQDRRHQLGYSTARRPWHDDPEAAYLRAAAEAAARQAAADAAREAAWDPYRQCYGRRTVLYRRGLLAGRSFIRRCKRRAERGSELCAEHRDDRLAAEITALALACLSPEEAAAWAQSTPVLAGV